MREGESIVFVGLELAGSQLVLSQILSERGQPADRWHEVWADNGPPIAFSIGSTSPTHAPLAHIEGATLSSVGAAGPAPFSLGALVAVNANVTGEQSMHRAVQLLDVIATRSRVGSSAPAVIVLLTSLRFTPEGKHAGRVHVAQFGAPAIELPAALRELPPLDGATVIRDRFLASVLALLRGKGLRTLLLAVSSICLPEAAVAAGALGEVAAQLVGRPCALDPRLSCALAPVRYSDALVETNGYFLYT